MQKYKKNWAVVRPVLDKYLKDSGITAKQLSDLTGLSYWSASRALREGIKNYNKRVDLLCAYFDISDSKIAKTQSDALGELQQLVEEVWDGTDSHAELLMSLIKTTISYKIEPR